MRDFNKVGSQKGRNTSICIFCDTHLIYILTFPSISRLSASAVTWKQDPPTAPPVHTVFKPRCTRQPSSRETGMEAHPGLYTMGCKWEIPGASSLKTKSQYILVVTRNNP